MNENKMANLAEDLLIEILSWLPVKSLARFRCVCKSWPALFENPNFISKHLHNSPNSILLLRRRDDVDSFMSLSHDTLDVLTEDLGFEYDIGPAIAHEFYGCFNGIACLYNTYNEDVTFWNPALRQIKILPKSSFVVPPNAISGVAQLGFGFDFKTNDFKLVKINRFAIGRGGLNNQIEVYSLSTDSWRLIDTVIPDGVRFGSFCHLRTCVNGVYSRLMSTLDRVTELVQFFMLTFNMTDEVFISTPMPQEVYTFAEHNHRFKALTALNGFVAYITYQFEPNERVKSFEISILDEYGSNGTWTKLYTIGPLFDIMRPLGFWKNDELFFETNNEELVLCGPTTNELKKLNVDGLCFIFHDYKESLVSLNGGTQSSF